MKRFAYLIAVFATCAFVSVNVAAGEDAGSKPALTVHMKDVQYKPDNASIPLGGTVAFVNDDGVTHTVTASDQSFDSKDISPGKSWQMAFTKSGTYSYICIYHPGMAGKITVTSATP